MLALDLGFSAIMAKSDSGVFTCPSAVFDISNSSMKNRYRFFQDLQVRGQYLPGRESPPSQLDQTTSSTSAGSFA